MFGYRQLRDLGGSYVDWAMILLRTCADFEIISPKKEARFVRLPSLKCFNIK